MREYFSARGLSAAEVEGSAELPRPNPRSGKFRQVWAERRQNHRSQEEMNEAHRVAHTPSLMAHPEVRLRGRGHT